MARIASSNQRSDVGARSLVPEVRPPRFQWHPEDALSNALVAGFEQALKLFALDAVFRQLRPQLVATAFEAVGNVLDEQQSQDNVLVPGGINLPTEGAGGLPQSVGVAQVAGHYVVGCHQNSALLPFVAISA
jgi:hypothetical protein